MLEVRPPTEADLAPQLVQHVSQAWPAPQQTHLLNQQHDSLVGFHQYLNSRILAPKSSAAPPGDYTEPVLQNVAGQLQHPTQQAPGTGIGTPPASPHERAARAPQLAMVRSRRHDYR